MNTKCHEFFSCKREKECPYYKFEGVEKCWEVESSLTPFVPAEEKDKIVFCKNCLYYQHMNKSKD